MKEIMFRHYCSSLEALEMEASGTPQAETEAFLCHNGISIPPEHVVRRWEGCLAAIVRERNDQELRLLQKMTWTGDRWRAECLVIVHGASKEAALS